MKVRFFLKRIPKVEQITLDTVLYKPKEKDIKVVDNKEDKKEKNNKNKKNKQEDMNFEDKINAAEATLEMMAPEVKVIKNDKGLIERTESSKIIITEDNRQLLKD